MVAQKVEELGYIPDPAAEQTSNRVEIVGYIGRDAQIRYTTGGLTVASVSLATHHWHDEHGAAVQTTDWHRIVAYGEKASACTGFKAGELVRVAGRLHTRSWRDRSGSHHERTEIVAADITRARRRPSQMPLDVQPVELFAAAAP